MMNAPDMQANAGDHPSGNVENLRPSLVAESPGEAFPFRDALSPFAWAALVALGAALAWNAWRASLEGGIWGDEIFSILISKRSISELIDMTAIDNHPPLYYLLFKAWNALGVAMGLTPGAFWGRLPGLAGWLAVVVAAWRVGRRTLGGDGGALLALAMAFVPQALWGMRNMRGYSIAAAALEICFLLMFAMTEATRRGELTRRKAAVGWTLYALAIEAALWSHLLAGFVAFLLGLWWIAESAALARREGVGRALRSPLAIGGALAQGLAALCFTPWLSQLHNQVRMLDVVRRSWMTPPTAINYLKVFALWYPLGGNEGNAPLPPPEFWSWASAFGCLTLLAPAAALAWGWRRARARASSGAAWRLAVAGLAVALLNVTIVWSVDRLKIQYIFHGPRYLLFTSAIWGAGLAGWAAWVGERAGRRFGKAVAWLLLAPWLAMNVVGTATDTLEELHGGLPKAIASAEWRRLPPAGSPLFVLPADLIPYFSQTLSRWKVMPVDAMARLPNGFKNACILLANSFYWIDREHDVAFKAVLSSGQLGSFETAKPQSVDDFTLATIGVFRADGARELAKTSFCAKPAPALDKDWEISTAGQWRHRDGWGFLEVSPNLFSYRWSEVLNSAVQLSRPLRPGEIAIRVQGAVPSLGDKPVPPVYVGIEGELAYATVNLAGGGSFDRTVRLRLQHRHEKPVVLFSCPPHRQIDDYIVGKTDRMTGFALQMVAVKAQPAPNNE